MSNTLPKLTKIISSVVPVILYESYVCISNQVARDAYNSSSKHYLHFVWRTDTKLEAEEANRSGHAHGLPAT